MTTRQPVRCIDCRAWLDADDPRTWIGPDGVWCADCVPSCMVTVRQTEGPDGEVWDWDCGQPMPDGRCHKHPVNV